MYCPPNHLQSVPSQPVIQDNKARVRKFRSICVIALTFEEVQRCFSIPNGLNHVIETRFLKREADQIHILITIINNENGSLSRCHSKDSVKSTSLSNHDAETGTETRVQAFNTVKMNSAFWMASLVFLAELARAATIASPTNTPSVLPRPDFHFPGNTGRTFQGSNPPQFPQPVKAPKGAPNVVLILIDDAGFGQFSTFGGMVPSPTMDRLAPEGLRFNRFHTTALCSNAWQLRFGPFLGPGVRP
jgi:Sulfatase